MDLATHYSPKHLPPQPYIGLFGNHHNNWRAWAIGLLTKEGVAQNQIYDSTDPGWRVVNDETGDELQPWVNELVKRQHRAMKKACCLIFSMDSRTRVWSPSSSVALPRPVDDQEGEIFAARCELGWLAGIKKKTFVWIPDDLKGRNYLRAVIDLYDWLEPVDDLHKACVAAASTLHSQANEGQS